MDESRADQLVGVEPVGWELDGELGVVGVGLVLGVGRRVGLCDGASEVGDSDGGVGRFPGEVRVGVAVGVRLGAGPPPLFGTDVVGTGVGAGGGVRSLGGLAPEPGAGRTRKYTAIDTTKTA